ncbi:hypothetical protein DCS_07370 [Drechmeria coniospora]|uniref:Uncharacterized protein n=1 Tax=Drechmeria coniospora TaxID=98403 RepID=A0A151GE85_DRECN|nr:hypothetical protein DCS_07370 [Drechmeria coniospora]KYK55407.1 hypothetical protein DCS_07370 [Drechmeria coniospora]ODA81987.1 hypothetical protein RJ55_00492 [Drechmeria coniospora]
MAAEVSHGRGGAGNINPDDTLYVDGEIARTGVEGSHGDGAYSSGRGGLGNIGDIGRAPTPRRDQDMIPEAALRPSQDTEFHTGRGGAGNEMHVPREKPAAAKTGGGGDAPISLADKLKARLFSVFQKK